MDTISNFLCVEKMGWSDAYGVPVKELCRQHGIASSTFYKWKAKYGGMEASDVKRLKELEEENRRLRQMYAELSLKSQLQAEIIKKL